jgi:hypothetical protein
MVEINFRSLFPTPFGFVNFGEDARELNRIIVKNIDEEMAVHQPETERRSFTHNEFAWQSKIGLENHYESFEKLAEAITSCIGPVLVKSGMKEEYAEKLKVTNLWANVIFGAGGFSEPHIHGVGNTLWTGVYYPKSEHKNLDNFDLDDFIKGTNFPGSGNLVLRDPAFVNKSLVKPRDNDSMINNEYYGASVTVIPRESLLILFPVWLEHYVQPTTDNKKRYSISFTIFKA